MSLKKPNTASFLAYLLAIVLCAFFMIIGTHWFFNNQIQSLEAKEANEKTKLDLGALIYDELQVVETEAYHLIITRHERIQKAMHLSIKKRIEVIYETLEILEHGGTITVNRNHVSEHRASNRETLTYQQQDKQEYYPQVLALRSELSELNDDLITILETLSQRNFYQKNNDPIKMGQTLADLLPMLKKFPPFFSRMKIHTNRMYAHSHESMDRIEQMIQARKRWYFIVEALLIVLIISLSIIIGYIISKRIHRISRKLAKAKNEADSANKAKSAFLANISHEFRTPLNGILGYTQILSGDPSLGKKQQASLRVIHQSGEHLLTLLNNILDVSILESKNLKMRPSEFSLRLFLEVLADPISVQANQKGLTFSCVQSPDLPQIIIGDEMRLRQVLLNLLNNAVKFTESGKIVFQIEKREPSRPDRAQWTTIRFSIEDTGVGIVSERHEEIFKPFHRNQEQVMGNQGPGLGLSISHRLVESMGSNLKIKSPVHSTNHGGFGCLFWFDVEFETPAHTNNKTGSFESTTNPELTVNVSPREKGQIQMVSPPPSMMKILLEYSMSGNISKLTRKIEELALQGSQYDEFLLKTRNLTDNFAFEELEHFLKSRMSDGPE